MLPPRFVCVLSPLFFFLLNTIRLSWLIYPRIFLITIVIASIHPIIKENNEIWRSAIFVKENKARYNFMVRSQQNPEFSLATRFSENIFLMLYKRCHIHAFWLIIMYLDCRGCMHCKRYSLFRIIRSLYKFLIYVLYLIWIHTSIW